MLVLTVGLNVVLGSVSTAWSAAAALMCMSPGSVPREPREVLGCLSRAPLKGDIDLGIDLDVDIDIDLDAR